MMEYTNLMPQIHSAHWGWTIALFLWLVGLSGMGMFLSNWVREKALVYLCTAASILGTLLVMSHLTRITNLPFAVFHSLIEMSLNLTSWMMIGILLLVVQCCGTLLLSLAYGGLIRCGRLRELLLSEAFSRIMAAAGVAVTIYSGFLLTQAVGVTLWNTALIPLLWIMSGMASAIGAIELLAISGRIRMEKVRWSRRVSLWTEAAELLTIFAFVHVALSSSSAAARAGAQMLLSGPQSLMFWAGVIVFGTLLPLALNLCTKSHAALGVSALLGVMGALLLRASVLFAGCYEPILF